MVWAALPFTSLYCMVLSLTICFSYINTEYVTDDSNSHRRRCFSLAKRGFGATPFPRSHLGEADFAIQMLFDNFAAATLKNTGRQREREKENGEIQISVGVSGKERAQRERERGQRGGS